MRMMLVALVGPAGASGNLSAAGLRMHPSIHLFGSYLPSSTTTYNIYYLVYNLLYPLLSTLPNLYCGFGIICDYLKWTSWNLKFWTRSLVTIDQYIVERCVLLGRAEILVNDRDTFVHQSGISIPIKNRHREKFRIFKSGTKLEAKFTSTNNRQAPKRATKDLRRCQSNC